MSFHFHANNSPMTVSSESNVLSYVRLRADSYTNVTIFHGINLVLRTDPVVDIIVLLSRVPIPVIIILVGEVVVVPAVGFVHEGCRSGGGDSGNVFCCCC